MLMASRAIHHATGDDFELVDADQPRNGTTGMDGSFIIQADLLIPGRGSPSENASVIVQDDKITWVGSTSDLPAAFKELPKTCVPILMPGLWDCHIHLIGITSFDLSQVLSTHPATMGARLARGLHDVLMSGFTSVRDVGGYACEVAPAVEEGIIVGPHIFSAGAAISQTAGHGDNFALPIGAAWDVQGVGRGENGRHTGAVPVMLADGVDECRKAIRLQVRRGAKLIKVTASGGVLSLDDNPIDQQFSDEELKVMVEEAARTKRIVAAHVHGREGIMAALRAGCKSLEHGTYFDEETIKIAKEKGVIYVPTRTIIAEGIKHPELMDPKSYAKMKQIAKIHEGAVKLAIKSGLTIAAGTDTGISIPATDVSLGKSASELAYLVEVGMTTLQAIEAATANGPLTLGEHFAPASGQIKVGYDADLIGVAKDPIKDIRVLKDGDNVTHVWKSGKLYKSPK